MNKTDIFKRNLLIYLTSVDEYNSNECDWDDVRLYCHKNNLLRYLEYSWSVDGLSNRGIIELTKLRRELIIDDILKDG